MIFSAKIYYVLEQTVEVEAESLEVALQALNQHGAPEGGYVKKVSHIDGRTLLSIPEIKPIDKLTPGRIVLTARGYR